MNLCIDEFSFQVCSCVSLGCASRIDTRLQCSCFPVRMEPSGGIEAFDEAALETVWRAIGEAEASPFGAGVGRTGNVEVIFRSTRMRKSFPKRFQGLGGHGQTSSNILNACLPIDEQRHSSYVVHAKH